MNAYKILRLSNLSTIKSHIIFPEKIEYKFVAPRLKRKVNNNTRTGSCGS